METNQKKGHPAGLYLIFFTGMWERFSYYGMRGILMLYLTKTWLEGGLGFDEATGSQIYGWATGLTYLSPLIGGWIADQYLGKRKSILLGGLLMIVSQFLLFAPELFISKVAGQYNVLDEQIIGRVTFFTGMVFLISGNAFFKPNINSIVGDLYQKGDSRIDSAYSIFYMGVNLGSFLAPLLVGVLADDFFAAKTPEGGFLSHGYRYGFLASAIGIIIGQILYIALSPKYLGDIGLLPNASKKEGNVEVKDKTPLTKEEKDRVSVIIIFFAFAVFFWSAFELAGSLLVLYADKYIDRHLEFFNWTIPTAWTQIINPMFIILLSPVFAILWNTPFGKRLSTPTKMGVGLMVLSLGFFFLVCAQYERGASYIENVDDTSIKANLAWIVLMYLCHTIGELCLSPVGMSIVNKLSPVRLASLLMGVWATASGLALVIGGQISAISGTLGMSIIFTGITVFIFLLGVIMLVLNKTILKMMHGVS